VSGFPEQTVEGRGSLVFCISKSFEISPHSGREGKTLTVSQVEGATQAPVIWAEAERELWSRWSAMNVFAENSPTQIYTIMENSGLFVFLDATFDAQ